MFRLIGAALILTGSVSVSLAVIRSDMRRIAGLRQFQQCLRLMIHELRYRRTALPDVFRMISKSAAGQLKNVLTDVAEELDKRSAPEASTCMDNVLAYSRPEPVLAGLLRSVGCCLGQLDLDAQLRELEIIHEECEQICRQLACEQKEKKQVTRMLGICTGIVVIILLY